jgi:hypothetical protein
MQKLSFKLTLRPRAAGGKEGEAVAEAAAEAAAAAAADGDVAAAAVAAVPVAAAAAAGGACIPSASNGDMNALSSGCSARIRRASRAASAADDDAVAQGAALAAVAAAAAAGAAAEAQLCRARRMVSMAEETRGECNADNKEKEKKKRKEKKMSLQQNDRHQPFIFICILSMVARSLLLILAPSKSDCNFFFLFVRPSAASLLHCTAVVSRSAWCNSPVLVPFPFRALCEFLCPSC